MTINDSQLISNITAAVKRHDETLVKYAQAANAFFTEIKQLLDALKVPGGMFGSKTVFSSRIDQEADAYALIIKNNLTNRSHVVGSLVLTFQTSGLDYHPGDGRLCGSIQVIASDGDYWAKIKSSKINPLFGIAAVMVSNEAANTMAASSQRKLQEVEGISRKELEQLWLDADNPTKWLRNKDDNTLEPFDTKSYIYRMLDQLYNPERKE